MTCPVQTVLTDCIGKLQRLEEERRMHMDQLAAQDDTLADMDRQGRSVQAQLDTAQAQLREVCFCILHLLHEVL